MAEAEVAERDVIHMDHRHTVVMHDHPKCHEVATVTTDGESFCVDRPTCMSCNRRLRGLMTSFVDGSVRAYS